LKQSDSFAISLGKTEQRSMQKMYFLLLTVACVLQLDPLE